MEFIKSKLKELLGDLSSKSISFIKRKPLTSLLIAFFGCCAIASQFVSEETLQSNAPVINAQNQRRAIATIPGVKPVDIYKSLEERGFTKEGPVKISGDAQSPNKGNYYWKLIKYTDECFYNATFYSQDANSIYKVHSLITCAKQPKALFEKETFDFFTYIASLPFTENNIEKTKNWIRNNLYAEESNLNHGEVKLIYKHVAITNHLMIEHSSYQKFEDDFYTKLSNSY